MQIKGIAYGALDYILESSKSMDPEEFVGLLQGKNGIITEVFILPATGSIEQNAVMKLFLTPHVKAVGSVRSHLRPNLEPSQADLQMFSNTGNCHIIVGRPYDRHSWACYDREGNIRELQVIDEKFENSEGANLDGEYFEEVNLKGTIKPRLNKATDVEFYESRVIMGDENVECQIIANKVDDMELYIRALFDWVTATRAYSIIDYWKTDEYFLINVQEDFFKVHKFGKEDKEALFNGKYDWSPEPLNDYKDRDIQAYVIIKIIEEEYGKQVSEDSSEDNVEDKSEDNVEDESGDDVEDKSEDNVEDEYSIEFYDSRVVMKERDVECQIIANKVDDMEPYIRTLFNWVTTTWDYSIVEDWNTDEYSLIHTHKGFFKVHQLGKDDIDGLFQGEYDWSPEPLKDYNDRQIQAFVYIKISKDDYNKLISEDESEDKVEDEYKIEFYDSRIVMKEEDVECQIIANKVDDMEPYIRILFNWVTTTWDYSIVDDWNTDEYSLIQIKEDFFKIHQLGKDDINGLFQGKYVWSPEPLKDYNDRQIQAYVYIKISEDEYVRLLP